jgi:hypothetical protein
LLEGLVVSVWVLEKQSRSSKTWEKDRKKRWREERKKLVSV